MSFVTVTGEERRLPLSLAWSTAFEEMAPVREFSFRRGQRNYAGWYWFATTGDHVGFESWVERDQLMLLDFDPEVASVASQPFRLHWFDEAVGKERHHTPDYFVRLASGRVRVVDVRPDHLIEPDDAEVFRLTAEACEMVGWEFARVGVVEAVLRANVRWLAGYRHRRHWNPEIAERLMSIDGSVPLMEHARRHGDPLQVLPVLFHLMWSRLLTADLRTTPLGLATLVAKGGPRE
ncbi:TnsA-like heteromeric transposase endonuclease subunit [Nonomuraea sp. NN258]|uniref:TnsA-like heteromeric transposase endonuclease subunit n=1 Tax=Nonomuraea antri TaxID=2730852 RepID=UPI001568DEE2|nr:TnsA-like heteromeric transposase endonuclease subunit [Nonomuraea antri]NRQ40481.1 TnsA-like heteromeric transposase endonuclease subunit [Nonomuraea antri]